LRWYYRNREKALEANKRWCAENRERRKAAKRDWEKKNRERNLEVRRKSANRWKKENPERHHANQKMYRSNQKVHLVAVARRSHLRRKYGITLADYATLLKKQSGRCAICGTTDPKPHKYLTVDHDHGTKKIRALLCFHCNAGLGHFRDDAGRLRAAIRYLTKYANSSEDNQAAQNAE
jgi:hypothetical protein